ncbi:MAG: 4-hydroxyphenylacetate 3-hydroxylase N-terminal domain-containing protein [Candidatus Bathyarchaeia archaeon]
MKTAGEYIESIKQLNPRVYLNGEKVISITTNPVTKSVVEAIAKIYDMTKNPNFEGIMAAQSPYTGEQVSRCVHIPRNMQDLEKKVEMAILTSQTLGTCNYRCTGADALTTLASVTYEMDKKLGTEYNKRFLKYLKWVQRNDLACTGSLTDVKGDRSKRPKEQDPDMHIRVVEKRDKGIIVRGARIHQSGAIAAHEHIIIPGATFRQTEEEYAVAFAIPNGAKGLTYICQYTPEDSERLYARNIYHLGNPIYGVRETCMIIFDDVFIPWERVFMCGEVEFTTHMWNRFARMHRMTCGGACKVGFGDLMIGAAQTMAEYLGTAEVPHVKEKIIEMVKINETLHACAVAAALKGGEEPEGSGVYLPHRMYSNVAKLNCADGFWKMMALLGDITGGLAVTLPSEKELENPDVSEYIKKYLKAAVPANKRMRMTKFIQNWCAGLHGVGTWHGAGSPQAQRREIYNSVNFDEKKKLAKKLAGIKE